MTAVPPHTQSQCWAQGREEEEASKSQPLDIPGEARPPRNYLCGRSALLSLQPRAVGLAGSAWRRRPQRRLGIQARHQTGLLHGVWPFIFQSAVTGYRRICPFRAEFVRRGPSCCWPVPCKWPSELARKTTTDSFTPQPPPKRGLGCGG